MSTININIDVDGLTFTFTDNWVVSKYDEWAFYRNQFSKMFNNIKSVDIIAADYSSETVWLIEVKDYRDNQRTKPTELPDEIALKVFHTLAAMPVARINASVSEEKDMSSYVCNASKLKVVLHLEQPLKHSKLRPRAINPADIKAKLKKLLKPIDAHPIVSEMNAMARLNWQVKATF